MKHFPIGIFFLLFSYSCYTQIHGQIQLESNEVMNMEGLYFWYADPAAPSHLFNRNITPKGDCFDIVNGYAFLTWFKGGMDKRNLMLSRLKIGTNRWVTIEFPETNTLYTSTYKGVDYAASPGGDSHRTTSVGISAVDGTVHLIFDQHTGPLNYRRSQKNIAFGPDDNFTLVNFLPSQDYYLPGEPISSCTYPNFITNAAGELLLNFRIGTARQGDMMGLFYNGIKWSSIYNIVKGNNVLPQEFNHYGDLYYNNETLYFCGSIRVKDSETELNQGIYFGKSKNQYGNQEWTNLTGEKFLIPLSNLLQPFKVAEPLPTPTSRMSSSANLVVSKNGTLHFSGQVSGIGFYHYYISPGKTEVVKSKAPGFINFAAGDRIYSVRTVQSTGRFVISSTQQDESVWREDFSFHPENRFANIAFKYYDGKLYVVSAEYRESDKHPFRFLTLDLGINNSTTFTSEHLSKRSIKLFPNPTSSTLFLERDYNSPLSINIYNTAGQLVFIKKSASGYQDTIDLHGLDTGIYFVYFEEKGKIIGFKKILLAR